MKISKEILIKILFATIFLLGILLRLKLYLANPSLWHDEAALAWNIKNKTYSELFGNLRFHQVAPPLFLCASKFIAQIFNANNSPSLFDMSLRFIPLISSFISIWVFYLLCKEVLKNNLARITALFLFCINANLLNYSYEFKPYMCDVLLTMCIILLVIKIDLASINCKKLITGAFLTSSLIWISLTTTFMLASGVIVLLLKKENLKKAALIINIVALNVLLYLSYYIISTYNWTNSIMGNFWNNQFVLPNLSNFFPLLIENLKYCFSPVTAVLLELILIIAGIILFYKEKNKTFVNMALLSFIFLIIASMLKFYPFAQRVVLFLIPLYIIFMIKPLDKISSILNIKSIIIILMTSAIIIPQLALVNEILTQNIKKINKGDFAREMIEIMQNNINSNDAILVNDASVAEYSYYSSFYDIKNKIVFERFSAKKDEVIINHLNILPQGRYWMYLPYNFNKDSNLTKLITNWAKDNTKVLYETHATQSSLIYLIKYK